MTCANCERLEEEVAWLKSELGIGARALIASDVSRSLGVRPQVAELILLLHASHGRIVTKERFGDELWPDVDRSTNVLSVAISGARKALGYDAIETIWGKGFRLTAMGLSSVDALIQPLQQNINRGGA